MLDLWSTIRLEFIKWMVLWGSVTVVLWSVSIHSELTYGTVRDRNEEL